MSQPLDESYFTWLYSQVGSVRIADPSRTYWGLFRQLYTKEFIWFVPNDDNRAEDGRALRKEFMLEREIVSIDDEWMHLGCSMLELFIGLARRLSFEEGRSVDIWFWMLIRNIGLEFCTDASPFHEDRVDATLEKIIWRTYRFNGSGGGLFPLHHPREDQRKVEIWYQLNAFLLENFGC